MQTSSAVRPYTFGEEVCNCAIHGLGIIFSVAGLAVLVSLSSKYGDLWTVASTAVFGVSMILLYTASTLYHAVPYPRVKKVLKKFDHIAIYYLIAGSYTPFLLVNMRGPVGWSVFAVIWSLALIGTVLKIVTSGSGTKLWSISLYLIMGWAIIFVSRQLFAANQRPSARCFSSSAACFTLSAFSFTFGKSKNTPMPSGT